MTGRGIPDSNGCYMGREFWIEFKRTGGWAVSLRPEQIGWLTRRARAGGGVYIAVRRLNQSPTGDHTAVEGVIGGNTKGRPKKACADELWLLAGGAAKEVRAGGLRAIPPTSLLGVWYGGPSSWDWNLILEKLTLR